LERKERELEKEKQERRELRRVVRRQENTIGALQQRLRSAGLAIDDDDDEALAPTVDDDVDKKFDDEQRPMDKEEKRRDEEKLLHVEEAKVDEKKKERRTKESEEETMTLLLEAMDQEATLPADGYHEEGGAKEQQLPQSEAKKNEDEDKNEVKNEDEKNENEENEDEEALLCDMSPTALLRKHLSPLRASPHPRLANDPTDQSPPPLALALGSDVSDDAEKLQRPPSGHIEVPRTPSPAPDMADGNGGKRTRQAMSPMFKALFLAKKKTAE
jgi:hypothetical protein